MSHREKLSIKRQRVRTQQGQVYYQTAGEGPPLVLIHGLSGSGRWWRKNIRPLARYFRVYAVDLLGFGGSRGQRFVLREASLLIESWLKQLGIARFHLGGHSMGGFVAADLAARHPEQVNRLVLVDAAAVPIRRSLARNAFSLVEALRYMPFDFLPVLATDFLRAGPVTMVRATHDILGADLTANLARIQADTLIVWGEKDTLLPLEMGERLHQALPQAGFVVIEGAGHNPMWDRPAAFNRVVLDFLRQKPGAS